MFLLTAQPAPQGGLLSQFRMKGRFGAAGILGGGLLLGLLAVSPPEPLPTSDLSVEPAAELPEAALTASGDTMTESAGALADRGEVTGVSTA